MAKYTGTAGGKPNIIGMDKARAHLKSLKSDLVVKDATSTKAGRGLNSILIFGEQEMRRVYMLANSAGIENADKIKVVHNVLDGWGRVAAKGEGLFFVEFGTGVNLNKGTPRGIERGFTPASWSLGAEGKGYLTGTRFVIFKGWWPVKDWKRVPKVEMRTFVTPGGKLIPRHVVQGNAPVNGMEAAYKIMQEMAAKRMLSFLKMK